MRGWVAVENQNNQKIAASQCIQGFEDYRTFKPSAHLTETRFQRFASGVNTISCVMILSSAQLHLENRIQQAFLVSAIAIN